MKNEAIKMDDKSKFSGKHLSEEELKEWQQTWIDINESIESLEEEKEC